MRESEKSLRIYFLVAAVLGLVANLLAIFASLRVERADLGLAIRALSALGLLLVVAFFVVAAQLPKLLREHPERVVQVVVALPIFGFVRSVAFAILGGRPDVIGLLVSIAIGWYLHRNVRRLADELKSEGR